MGEETGVPKPDGIAERIAFLEAEQAKDRAMLGQAEALAAKCRENILMRTGRLAELKRLFVGEASNG